MTKALIFIPTLTSGGAERVASLLANHWSCYPGTSVTILLLFDVELFYPIDSKVELSNLGLQPRLGAIQRTWSLIKAIFSLRRAIKAANPDFVLSFMNKYNVFCLASLLKTSIPVIVSERDSPLEPNRELNWKLRKILYPYAAGIIAQTGEGKRYLIEKIGRNNIAVIYNPIRIKKRQRPIKKREKFVLNVGRLVEKKGHEDLLRVFAKLDAVDWHLVICGDGPLRESLKTIANSLSINERTHFMGTVKDVDSWYARAGIFAFTSYFEGFPNALAEAMVAGVPSVSYNCPTGPSELIQHQDNGYLVEVGNIDMMASYLKNLINNSDLSEKISQNAIKVADKLDATTISRQYFDFCVSAARLQVSKS